MIQGRLIGFPFGPSRWGDALERIAETRRRRRRVAVVILCAVIGACVAYLCWRLRGC